MAKFVVEGGARLSGEVTPAGNKNAALPLIAAALLTDEPVTLQNLPAIRDVEVMLDIAAKLGAKVERADQAVTISGSLSTSALDPQRAGEIRASLLFAGPVLARCGKVSVPRPGGDIIGRRRVDTHFLALEALGAELSTEPREYRLVAKKLASADVVLDEASVTATESALMCAALIPGRTVIHNAASEPHVQELARFLGAMGARIDGIGTNTVAIEGKATLHGASHRISSDHMEVGSFIGLAAVTKSELIIKDAMPEHLRMTRLVFERLGVRTQVEGGDLRVLRQDRYAIEPDIGGAVPEIKPQPWPGFPTDLTSIATVVATQSEGIVLVHEWMFEGRLYFVDVLSREMGARIVLCDPHRAVVMGPSQLYGAELRSPDIRAGMALLAAALCAKGTSVINNIEQIDRGYERLDERLRGLGAKIERQG
ncbi:MAG TPA: UDP-N-acetylglucosamine 1-carboxyvinyltransferase [Candidatus Dormibacteraeota bacterium]|jgi:UDP-N-acetylglucosamine 1-carboxyvinyltransferase|nr:UDP-N-acetylglucosamine 1-carboxyvinyltransferase [Candidatus Dormibacteraeota bacterium]